MEKCSTEALFEKQLHPYTKALLSAVAVPDIHRQRERIVLKGEVTSPIDPPARCCFADRCIYAKEECYEREPMLREVEPGHFAACHFC